MLVITTVVPVGLMHISKWIRIVCKSDMLGRLKEKSSAVLVMVLNT